MQECGQNLVVAIDPGSNKCGIAVVDLQGIVLQLLLVGRHELASAVAKIIQDLTAKGYQTTIVMGNGTQHKKVSQELQAIVLDKSAVQMVEEYGSTLEARELYWKYNNPTWWQRLLPPSWRNTPPLDAYAALVIAKRYIAAQ